MIDVSGADGDETARIKTQLGKPAHRDRTRFDFREILTDPHKRPPRGHAPCEPRDKAGRNRALPAGLRKHLVHGAQGEAALQVCIDLRMAERHLAQAIRRALRLDALDAPA